MATQKLIAVKEFCTYHNISTELIHELHRNEIIELVMVKRTSYITEKNLPHFEKAVRLYNDLHVNIEGIQTILHLLSSIEKKEAEITKLRNLLDFYTNP
jgi:chaperone modulatory protein CbpM